MSSESGTTRVPTTLRIERLPDCKFLAWQAIIVSIAMFAEAVEINSFGFILPLVQKDFSLTSTYMGYLGSASNVGMLLGALSCSALADRMGRKKLFMLCIIVWGAAGILFALAPSPKVLFVARIIFGIGAGAQIPTSLALLAEMSPAKSRAKYVVLSLLASPVAVWFGASVASFILSVSSWRVMFVVISLLSLWVIIVYKAMPESARWLETKGRVDEAEKVIEYIEIKVEKSSGKPLPKINAEDIEKFNKAAEARAKLGLKKAKFADLWKSEQLRHSVLGMCWSYLQMLGYFALATWLTALLVSKGFSVVRSTRMIAIFAVGGFPAYFGMVWLLNKFGRKPACIIMALLAAGTAYIYGSMNTFTSICIAGFIYQFCQYGYNMCCSTYWPELLPTYIRGTGMGWFQAWGRFGGITGAIIVGYIMTNGGYDEVFYLIIACNVISVFLIGILGKETKDMVA